VNVFIREKYGEYPSESGYRDDHLNAPFAKDRSGG